MQFLLVETQPYSNTGAISFVVTMPGEENPYKFMWSGGKMYGEMWGPDIGSGMTQLTDFGDTATGFLDMVKGKVAGLSGAQSGGDPDDNDDGNYNERDDDDDVEEEEVEDEDVQDTSDESS